MSVRIFGFASFAHFANDGSTFLYPLMIAFLHFEFPQANLGYLGLITIINPVISGLMSTPVGILADMMERKGLLISLGLALSGLSAYIFAFTVNHNSISYFNIIAGVTALGLGQSFYHPIGASILRSEYGAKLPTILGVNGSFGSFGRGIYPFIITLLIGTYGLMTGFEIFSVIGFVSAMVVGVGLGNPSAKAVSRNASQEKMAKPDTSRKEITSKISMYKVFIISLSVVVFLRAMFIRSIATFAPTYFTDLTGSQILGPTIFSIGVLTPVIGQTLFGFLTTRKGGFYTITMSTVFSGIAFFLVLISGSHLLFSAVFFAIYAFFTYSGFPILIGYLNQVVPRQISSSSGGVIWGLGQLLGGATGIAVSSLLVLYQNITTAYWLMLIFTLGATLLLPLLRNQERKVRGISSADGAES